MKNINKILVLSTLVLGGLVLSAPKQQDTLIEWAGDLNNNGVQLNVRNTIVGDATEFDISKTFAQYGVNEETNNYVVRFATAVKGSLEEITYTRVAEGKEDAVKNVTTVYQGLESKGEVVYYNPETQDVTTDEAYKGMYYWACYLIEYSSEDAKSLNITASIKVVDSENNVLEAEPKTTSLTKLLEADMKEYSIAGSFVEDTYVTSGAKDTECTSKENLNLYKDQNRTYLKVNLSDILDNEDFKANKDSGRFIFTFALKDGLDLVRDAKYSFYGAPVKHGEDYNASIPFNVLTWNTVNASSGTYGFLNTSNLTKIFEDNTIEVSKNLSNPEGYLQVKLQYDQIDDFICMDEGDNYGVAVFQLRANKKVVLASIESKTLAAPTLAYVYKK